MIDGINAVTEGITPVDDFHAKLLDREQREEIVLDIFSRLKFEEEYDAVELKRVIDGIDLGLDVRSSYYGEDDQQPLLEFIANPNQHIDVAELAQA